MWNSLISSVVISGLAFGQGPEPRFRKGEPAIGVRYDEDHRTLHQGGQTKVGIVLYRPTHDDGCCSDVQNPDQTNLVPISLDLGNIEGLSVEYKDGRRYKRQVSGTPIPIKPGTQFLELRIKANKKIALGEQQLAGQFRFRELHNGQPGEVRELPVAITVTVVRPTAAAADQIRPYEKHPFKRALGGFVLILLFPLILPAILLLLLACDVGECP